jgi:transcriptional regulator with XRE-family HTH domain
MSATTACQCSSTRANRTRRMAAIACCPDVKHLGLVIRQRRSAARMNQPTLAYRADMDRAYISRVENGRTLVGWSNLGRLATALDTTIAALALDAERLLRSGRPARVRLGRIASRATGPGRPPSVAALGLAFRRARLDRGLTRAQCAHVSGLSIQAIEKLEFGKRAPRWDTLCALSVVLTCTVSELVVLAEAAEVKRGTG